MAIRTTAVPALLLATALTALAESQAGPDAGPKVSDAKPKAASAAAPDAAPAAKPDAASTAKSPAKYPVYPAPKWAAFKEAVEVEPLARQGVLGRGRFRPVDTAARELMRVLANRDVLEYPIYDEAGKVVLDRRGNPVTIAEPPALTLFGMSQAPQYYLDAPLFEIVSIPLRRKMFDHNWTVLEAVAEAETDPVRRAAADKALMDVKGPLLSLKRYFSYREILGEMIAAVRARPAAVESAGLLPGLSGGASAAARDAKADALSARLAKLDGLNSAERAALRRDVLDAFADGLFASAGRALNNDEKHADNINKHLNHLRSVLDYFDNAGAQLTLMPVSSDPMAEWEAPDALAMKIAAVNGDKSVAPMAGNVAPEAVELPAKFVIPASLGWDELDEAGLRATVLKWKELRAAFGAADAEAVNRLAPEVFSIFKSAHPEIKLGVGGRPLHYPSETLLAAESFYNGKGKFYWVWAVFFVAGILLMGAMCFRGSAVGRALLTAGIPVFAAAFLIMCVSFGFRLVLAQRGSTFSIPIANQYESLLWCVFFGSVVGTGVALAVRSWASIAALVGVCVLGVLVMGISYLKPLGVSGELTPENPVLRAALLPFHVGSMVGGYAVIALGFGVGLLYMMLWFLAGSDAEDKIELTMVDRFHNALIKLSFLLLLVGLILGAAWGDVAWGRWWGWDPKETWAFITWLVYAIVIHARLIVRDRGPVTGCLSIIGFAVMLFTWFGTNYGITRGELHAYTGSEGDNHNNVVPYIWMGMTGLFPFALGISAAAFTVFRARNAAREGTTTSGGANLALAALAFWVAFASVGGMLYARYGLTPEAAWEYVAPAPGAEPKEVLARLLPRMALDQAAWYATKFLLVLWTLLVFALSATFGLLLHAIARKDGGGATLGKA